MNASVWVTGARPRTLAAAVAPVSVGTAVAAHLGAVVPLRAGLALVVSLALQVGVNYANDYSDGVKGVDDNRKGPTRITAGGLASPAAVKRAAVAAFGVASAAGIALGVIVNPWLIALGALCVLAGILYSGGPKPYASAGMGEVMVLIFFGLVATAGSTYVHLKRVPLLAVAAAIPIGLLACAILLVNNLRDVDSDAAANKRTLAVRIGPERSRRLFRAVILVTVVSVAAISVAVPGALIALAATPLAARPLRAVRPGATPVALVGALRATARLQLVLALLLSTGLAAPKLWG